MKKSNNKISDGLKKHGDPEIYKLSEKQIDEYDLLSKWDNFGLLYDLSVKEKLALVPIYEGMASYIVDLNLIEKDFGQNTIEAIIFPVIYRIIKSGGKIDDIPHLYKDCVNFINDKKDEVIELQKGYDLHIDIEAELFGMYVENYLNKNKDE